MTALQPLIDELSEFIDRSPLSDEDLEWSSGFLDRLAEVERMVTEVLRTNRRVEEAQLGKIMSLEAENERLRKPPPVHEQVIDELEWLREALPFYTAESGDRTMQDVLLFLTHRALLVETDPMRAVSDRNQ